MSITSEILRIKSNIANAYDKCYRKGATMPAMQDSQRLPYCIESIPSESGGIPREVSYNGTYQRVQDWYTFTLPNTALDLGEKALYYAFYEDTRLDNVDFNNLTNISGLSAMHYAFYGATRLASFYAPHLETITGQYALSYAYYNSGIQSVYLPELKEINASGCWNYAFNNCTNISTVYLPKLEYINGSGALARAFAVPVNSNNSLSSVEFTSLKTLRGVGSLRFLFENRTNLQILYFPALRSDSFGTIKTQFDNMLAGIDGCTVHFPSNLQSVLSPWTSVQNGFSGTNTTISYDLDPTS